MDEEGHAGDPGRLLEPEHLLQLHREDGLFGAAVVDPDPGPTRYGDPLGRQLLQPRGLTGGPGQEPLQCLPGVDARQVGPSPGTAQLGLQPLVHARVERVLGDLRPRFAEVVAQEREPLPQYPGVGRPPQQP